MRAVTGLVMAALAFPVLGSADAPTKPKSGKPHLVASPSTGDLSVLDANNNTVPGTTITLSGSGFEPGRARRLPWAFRWRSRAR